jgi:hypothetical protein
MDPPALQPTIRGAWKFLSVDFVNVGAICAVDPLMTRVNVDEALH